MSERLRRIPYENLATSEDVSPMGQLFDTPRFANSVPFFRFQRFGKAATLLGMCATGMVAVPMFAVWEWTALGQGPFIS
ncbi:hypothetical protein LPJ64_004088 [Coemansia asiatica]|uniref:Uncharacterized protein n=1 Tax=Coemansia asiatica TaxID=1052880 RepID=A0A9W7XIK4_9FUNG|nr:hypothetical protein LPJ64_004088 [Coemansia asiatica]